MLSENSLLRKQRLGKIETPQTSHTLKKEEVRVMSPERGKITVYMKMKHQGKSSDSKTNLQKFEFIFVFVFVFVRSL
jgi:hypothetical protein